MSVHHPDFSARVVQAWNRDYVDEVSDGRRYDAINVRVHRMNFTLDATPAEKRTEEMWLKLAGQITANIRLGDHGLHDSTYIRAICEIGQKFPGADQEIIATLQEITKGSPAGQYVQGINKRYVRPMQGRSPLCEMSPYNPKFA